MTSSTSARARSGWLMQAPRLLVRLAQGVLALGMSAALAAGAPGGSIEAFIDRAMPASGVPGLAYAVVADGDVTSAGARGVVELGGDTAVTVDTPFVIGSISKSFTALAVMQLVEAGKIDLDTELSRYLHAFSGRPAGAITIRQLLSHTSGFSTLQGNAGRPQATGEKDDLARGVDRLAQVKPAHKPGETWAYSNANYHILGRLIEVVSGQEFQTYVATHILEPVGMRHSFVADGRVHASMATGHRPWFGTRLPISESTTDRATAPQGGIVASASDLARYLGMMMNGEDDVLSAEGKALMMRPASDVSPDYGFGWKLDPGAGVVWHDGISPGFETLATMLPTQKKAVIVLVNGGSGMGFSETGHLRVGISDRALGLGYDSAGTGWSRKALFIGLVVLPILYVLGMIRVWFDRAEVRVKSGAFGVLSLWFPLLTTSVAAWVLLALVPSLYGTPIRTLMNFSPDFGLALVASAVTGVLLTVFRLGVAYTGRTRPG
jgi:CubicO group peptidase (beta-lactamase class C family)